MKKLLIGLLLLGSFSSFAIENFHDDGISFVRTTDYDYSSDADSFSLETSIFKICKGEDKNRRNKKAVQLSLSLDLSSIEEYALNVTKQVCEDLGGTLVSSRSSLEKFISIRTLSGKPILKLIPAWRKCFEGTIKSSCQR